ncbi:calcium-binding protein [Baekduia soli]|uniref:Calcium-binding protein n=1 Tax=Baekduia soli TaxID=496014 RepID=A0A5B8U8B0_9ACTN|nr:calcium-binding protein [Baekduia soli]
MRARSCAILCTVTRRPAALLALLAVLGGSTAAVAATGPRLQIGTRGPDVLVGGPGRDRILGRGGADRIRGRAGADILNGGPGNDVVFGDAGNDLIIGGPGQDTLLGGAGNDVIRARDGFADTISCGAGRDRVIADALDVVAGDCEVVRRG